MIFLAGVAILDEVGGAPERSQTRLALVRDLPLLPIEPAIIDIAQAYISHKTMSGCLRETRRICTRIVSQV